MNPSAPTQPSPKQVFDQAQRLMALGDYHEAHQRAGLLRAHFGGQAPTLALHGMTASACGQHELALPDLRAAADALEAEAAADGEDAGARRASCVRVMACLARSLEALGLSDEADRVLARAGRVGGGGDAGLALARVEILAGRGAVDAARSALGEAEAAGLDERSSAMAAGAVALADRGSGGEMCRMLAQRVRSLSEVVGVDADTQSDVLRRCAALFDRADETDEAFRAFTRAANLRRGTFDAAAHARLTQAVIQAWTPGTVGTLRRPSVDASNLVFVVGAPESGGVELARAMTGHPSVGTTGPSDALTYAAVRFAGATTTPHRPVVVAAAKVRGTQLKELAEHFLEIAGRRAWPSGRSVVVDAGALHAHLVGLAAAALPGARFVLVRRERRSHALACYFGAMRGHHAYSRDLATTASYLRDLGLLLDHWESSLPAMGHTVVTTTREALASDGAAEVSRVLAALGASGSGGGAPRLEAGAWDRPERYEKRLAVAEPFLS